MKENDNVGDMIRRDEFLRGGITTAQKDKIRDILFFNENLDVYKDGVIRASCAENRPTHRAYLCNVRNFSSTQSQRIILFYLLMYRRRLLEEIT
jgi:hypothetical protein